VLGTVWYNAMSIIGELKACLYYWSNLLLPSTPLCSSVKVRMLRKRGAIIGKNVRIYEGVWIASGEGLVIGDDVDISPGVVITTAGKVYIGDRTLIGYGTKIISANHVIPPNHGKIRFSGHEFKPVIIENDVWIGAQAIILPGKKIGEGAVVAAGSVVTHDVEPFTIVAGIPAKEIRKR
jgi:acetyltransferase-like isoleucine patch superfamily enzyme